MTTTTLSVLAGATAISLLQGGTVPIWVPLVIVLVIVLIFWWGMTRNNIPEEEAGAGDHGSEHAAGMDEEVAADEDDGEVETAVAAEMLEPEEALAAAPATPDNLQMIEGIGPKIEGLLNAAGIMTFEQLAGTDVQELERIVRDEGGIRVADPETWPAQASLAAGEDWAGLDVYQKRLVGGRERKE